MIEILMHFGPTAFFSLWGSVYIGSLVPSLWKQRNYRGAVGIGLLAGMTLFLPTVLAVFR